MQSGPGRAKFIAASLVAVVGAIVAVRAVTAAAALRPSADPRLRVPTLGPIQTVDENDVGDPFVLNVPAGIKPPSNLPFMNTGPDAYVSAPWNAASVSAAERTGWYVLFGTTDWQSNVPTAVSTDRVHWTQAPDALPQLPSWALPTISKTWAPAALRAGSTWILYFSTEEASSQLECIGRAVAASPTGPYVDNSPAPMLCQRSLGGSIDPSLVTSSGTRYLTWKSDGNSSGKPDFLWSQKLSPDGLSLLGVPHQLLTSSASWTKGIVEAPAMVPSTGGGYWLFYSGGGWDSNRYGTGIAHCATVTGPCSAVGDGPYLSTSGSLISPGGLETFTAHDGRLWVAFTALIVVPSTWHPSRYYYNRVLDIAPMLTR